MQRSEHRDFRETPETRCLDGCLQCFGFFGGLRFKFLCLKKQFCRLLLLGNVESLLLAHQRPDNLSNLAGAIFCLPNPRQFGADNLSDVFVKACLNGRGDPGLGAKIMALNSTGGDDARSQDSPSLNDQFSPASYLRTDDVLFNEYIVLGLNHGAGDEFCFDDPAGKTLTFVVTGNTAVNVKCPGRS